MTSQSDRIAEDDYDAIEAAVMETARGRWFLSEFARRTRAADTAALLAAIDRLENAMRSSMRAAELAAQERAAALPARKTGTASAAPQPTSAEQLDAMEYESKILYFS
jgi:chemotaxis protein CheZ